MKTWGEEAGLKRASALAEIQGAVELTPLDTPFDGAASCSIGTAGTLDEVVSRTGVPK